MGNKCHQDNITKKFWLSVTTLAVIATTVASVNLQPAQASLGMAAKAMTSPAGQGQPTIAPCVGRAPPLFPRKDLNLPHLPNY